MTTAIEKFKDVATANTGMGVAIGAVFGAVFGGPIGAAIGGTMGNGLAITVSSTGTKMVITSAFGVATAGTEGTNAVYSVGL